MERESWELWEQTNQKINSTGNMGKISWLWVEKGQRHQYHTHPVMIATLNCCYYYYSLRRAKSVGKGGNQVWGPRAWEIGTEEMDGMRRDWNRHRAGLQYCSRGLLRKKEIWRRQARQGGRERDRHYFPFSLCSCARCFFSCVYDHFLI
jgi:hypothetical protein